MGVKSAKETCWKSDLEISKDDKCPYMSDDHKPTIIVPFEIWNKIMKLTRELDTEWLGYLHGSHLQDGNWKVTDITVPKQEVTGATVKPTETHSSEGVVHSHVNMGVFFSSTDDDYLNENHDFSIVVNQSGESKAIVRKTLPCKTLSVVDADVSIEFPESDVEEFLKEARKNIAEEPDTIEETKTTRDIYKKGGWKRDKRLYGWDYGDNYGYGD